MKHAWQVRSIAATWVAVPSAAVVLFLYLAELWAGQYEKSEAVNPGWPGSPAVNAFHLVAATAVHYVAFALLLALGVASVPGFRHSIRAWIVSGTFVLLGWGYLFLTRHEISAVDEQVVPAGFQFALLITFFPGLLIFLNARFLLVARRRPAATQRWLKVGLPALLRIQRAIGIGVGVLSLLVFVLLFFMWVEPGFEARKGYLTEDALTAGIGATAALAGGLLWTAQAIRFPPKIHRVLLACQVPLLLQLGLAATLGGSWGPVAWLLLLAGLWLVGGLYLLAPLLGVEIRFLPGQARFVRPLGLERGKSGGPTIP